MSEETDEAVVLRYADWLEQWSLVAETDAQMRNEKAIAKALRSLVARVEALQEERDRAWAEAEQGRDALAEGRTKQKTSHVIDLGAALKRSLAAEEDFNSVNKLEGELAEAKAAMRVWQDAKSAPDCDACMDFSATGFVVEFLLAAKPVEGGEDA